MIKIICSGKIKENYLKDAIVEYSKRISKYDKLEIIELPDYDYDLKKTLQKEKENIIKNINLKDYNILLDLNGKSYTSLELADKLDKVRITNSNITFKYTILPICSFFFFLSPPFSFMRLLTSLRYLKVVVLSVSILPASLRERFAFSRCPYSR